MKRIQLIYGLLLIFILQTSCSKDDTVILNGFTLNGTFYKTNLAMASSGDPYYLIFSNTSNNDNSEQGHGYFILNSGAKGDAVPLVEGTYSTKNGSNSLYGISGFYPISFSGTEENSIYTQYWRQDKKFKSGVVNINSITTATEGVNNQVTEIDVDYVFKWDGVTVRGNYKGKVEPN